MVRFENEDGGDPPPPAGKGVARKVFTLAYKLWILECAEALRLQGGLAEFLRREGLYASHLSQWRKLRAEGALGQGRRGRPGKEELPLQRENRTLKRQVAVLARQLAEAEFLIRLQREVAPRSSFGSLPRESDALMEQVDRARTESTLVRICEALAISRKAYYRWLKKRLGR